MDALDNPVWSCLTTRHAHLALGDRHALRYPLEFSPLSGLPAAGRANMEALQTLVDVGDAVAVAGAHVPEWPENWETLHRIALVQMVRREASPLPEGRAEIVPLSAADVADMLALVELTHPGPFRERTIELGAFVGVRERGRLLAMAGERMWVGDHREVSAVCTHPEAQGRGFARALMARVINRMLRAGQTPFLHVESVNARAIRTYEGLGFAKRAEFPLLYAKRTQ
jgi:ribosomal protein S18 acetylase RimI-like enzyme